jgi:hypothetical protein
MCPGFPGAGLLDASWADHHRIGLGSRQDPRFRTERWSARAGPWGLAGAAPAAPRLSGPAAPGRSAQRERIGPDPRGGTNPATSSPGRLRGRLPPARQPSGGPLPERGPGAGAGRGGRGTASPGCRTAARRRGRAGGGCRSTGSRASSALGWKPRVCGVWSCGSSPGLAAPAPVATGADTGLVADQAGTASRPLGSSALRPLSLNMAGACYPGASGVPSSQDYRAPRARCARLRLLLLWTLVASDAPRRAR